MVQELTEALERAHLEIISLLNEGHFGRRVVLDLGYIVDVLAKAKGEKVSKTKSFEFESMELTVGDVFRLLRVHYDLTSNPAEIELIEDVDNGEPFKLLELPPDDVKYIIARLGELDEDYIRAPDPGIDAAYEDGLDKERLE